MTIAITWAAVLAPALGTPAGGACPPAPFGATVARVESGRAVPDARAQDDPDGGGTGQEAAASDEGQARREIPSVADATKGLVRRAGLFETWIDEERGRVLARVPPPGERGIAMRLLYVEGLVVGLGSNPVGLDRGQIGPARVVELVHAGGRILVRAPNLRFRAQGADAAGARAARESFASSILWAGKVAARDPDGSVLVDWTDFAVRDAHGSARALKAAGQGSWKLDRDRSVLDTAACLAFPENLELEAILTFASDEPGALVRATAPEAESVTLVQHQSLVKLPDAGYHPRHADPRQGHFAIAFQDTQAPLGAGVDVHLATRFRLEKTDPAAERSSVVKPIVYWLDPATPEPVRSALLEGARWWAEAFEAAGFQDAFRVEMLPPGVHPLDVRYNVIQWVHRSTRGWSYGGGVTDPRTGERIKGHVTLGSLRVRQDLRLFEALAGAESTGSGGPDDGRELALARLRQLAAHEVGHTLGLAHNFAASTEGRASVMDYPAPWVRVRADGTLEFDQAYGVGVGAWDRHAIRWLYAQAPPGTAEDSMLEEIAREARDEGLLFLSDGDARPAGAADPRASLWDNGSDPAAELVRVLGVRRVALERFGERNLAPGRPRGELEQVFALAYLLHRYQVDAAAKALGGVLYEHALVGDGTPPAQPVPAAEQRAALEALLRTLAPAELDVPDATQALLAPAPPGWESGPERFQGGSGPVFDSLGAAATAAGATLAAVLQPERAKRLLDQHRRDEELPGLDEVLARTVDAVFTVEGREGERLRAVRREVQSVLVARLVALSSDARAAYAVRAQAEEALSNLLARLRGRTAWGSPAERAHLSQLAADLDRFLNRDDRSPRAAATPAAAPPGSPIGFAPELRGCGWEGGG